MAAKNGLAELRAENERLRVFVDVVLAAAVREDCSIIEIVHREFSLLDGENPGEATPKEVSLKISSPRKPIKHQVRGQAAEISEVKLPSDSKVTVRVGFAKYLDVTAGEVEEA